MVKYHRRKLDAKQRQAKTGETFQAAVNAVRKKPYSSGPVAAARKAVIMGMSPAVDAFIQESLGRTPAGPYREAVEMALISDWVTSLRGIADESALDLLRLQAKAEYRRWQPLWERNIQGQKIMLLSQMSSIQTEEELPLDNCTPDVEVLRFQSDDERLIAVLRGLDPEEAAIAWHWAEQGGSWGSAARAIGRPFQYGEQVRRKLRRLGRLYHASSSAVTASQAAAA